MALKIIHSHHSEVTYFLLFLVNKAFNTALSAIITAAIGAIEFVLWFPLRKYRDIYLRRERRSVVPTRPRGQLERPTTPLQEPVTLLSNRRSLSMTVLNPQRCFSAREDLIVVQNQKSKSPDNKTLKLAKCFFLLLLLSVQTKEISAFLCLNYKLFFTDNRLWKPSLRNESFRQK